MPLPSPILDDRSYAQLRDALIQRIPVYNPEWSDHNPSDPGITLIELFAYLGETLLFRFNQIPEATKLEFLRLLQIPLRPPQPARALLRIATEVLDGVVIEPGTVARAGEVEFELQTEVWALPLRAVAVAKLAAPLPDPDDEPERFTALQAVVDALDGLESDEEVATYEPVLLDADGAGPPIDFGATVDDTLWIALFASDELAPAAVEAALVDGETTLLNIGFVPDLAAPLPDQIAPCPGEGWRADNRTIDWQISTGRLDADGRPIYAPVSVVGDSTGGLEREGVVRLELPEHAAQIGVFEVEPALIGTRDFPPAIDEELAPQLVAWLRAFRRDGGDLGRVQWIAANVSDVVQQRQARTVFLGTGTGQPNQEFQLPHIPVIPHSLVLEVEEPQGWVAWEEVDGFHASAADDRHFMLDAASGIVRFGNGLQGRAPQWAQRIRAKTWLYGGGPRGNVASGEIEELVGPFDVEVDNPLAAWGGAVGETIAEALERIPGELRRRDRAVTRDDFAELAMQTPGADLIRAETLPRFYPPTRESEVAGVVSVVVWSRVDVEHPRAPLADRRTLRRVCEWLDTRRLITTELYVIPPRYVPIAVSLGLAIKPGYPIVGVRRWAELIVRQYLAPVPPYGPEGRGWPLGRRVVAGELEAAVSQVEGVEYVRNLRLAGWDAMNEVWVEVVADREADPPIEAMIELRRDEVVELAEITVVEGPALVPGVQINPPEPARTPVPVPIDVEEC